MKNAIIFNLNNFDNECISMINDGSNSLAIEARKENFSNPAVVLTLANGSTATESLTAAGGVVKYTIPQSYYNLSGIIGLKIKDGSYESELITIKCTVIESGYSLAVKYISDTSYELISTAKATGATGAQGPQGYSAYEVAVRNGYDGTETEWLASLRGPAGQTGATGPPGPQGYSAYEVAVRNGYDGTETEWLASLRGPAGQTGATGPQGPKGDSVTGSALTISLAASGWTLNSDGYYYRTATASGVTASNNIIVDTDNPEIKCTAQAANSLTFRATKAQAATVKVMIFG